MPKVAREVWDVCGEQFPIHIYAERRSNNRISITKNGVNIRLPIHIYIGESKSWRTWASSWLEKQVKKRPDLSEHHNADKYVDGYQISTATKIYTLSIEDVILEPCKGQLIGDQIHLEIYDLYTKIDRVKAIRSMIGRLIGKDQLDRVTKRIHEINDHYFKVPINKVRIRNNTSNWGSCSSKGNINISVRTLLAPLEVQDYIFVHELSHRLEMNHSPAYWEIVGKVMPSYKDHERWLKTEGRYCEL